MDLEGLISKLSPEQRKLLELKLKQRGLGTKALKTQIDKDIYCTIGAAEEKECYPLSSSQRRMYILNLFTEYSLKLVFQVEGKLHRDRLEEAFQKLVKRHECLRLFFELKGEEPVQKIHDNLAFKVKYYDSGFREAAIWNRLRGKNNSLTQVETEFFEYFFRPFDLSHSPLLRVGLVKLSETRHLLVINIHHIIMDGVTMGILSREFILLYLGGELPEPRLRYRDFAIWQSRLLENVEYKKQEAYWLDLFSGETPVLNMPTDYPRPAMQSFEGRRIRFEIKEETLRQLKKLAVSRNVTVYMVLLAVYNTLLFRYTGQEDIAIGTISSGREQGEIQNLVGIFINPLAIRNYPVKDKTFEGFLKELKHNTLKAFENQLYPFGDLLEKVVKKKDHSRNPLFDTMLIFQNVHFKSREAAGLRFGLFVSGNEFDTHTQQDITLWVDEEEDNIKIALDYCTALFKQETMERFIGHFLILLRGAAENPGLKLSEIEMITEEEKQQILTQFNDTGTAFPAGKTLHRLFEEQAARTGDHMALVGREYGLTYRELNEKSDLLTCFLKEKGVQPDTIVPLVVERSVEMIIAILGILKAGGAYLPIDPQYPQERIDFMLKDSGARILLTNLPEGHHLFNCQLSIVNCQLSMNPAPNALAHPTHLTHPTHLCYIIYTSGTTGKPKGVMVGHQNVVVYLFAFLRKFQLNSTDTVIQLASYCFDVFIEEVFPVLLKGGKLVIPGVSERKDMDILSRLIVKHQVNMIDCTPLELNEFNKLDAKILSSVHTFISGGDVLKEEYVDKLLKIGKVYNTYGPTESTVCTTYYHYTPSPLPSVPIGKPIANYKIYIFDKFLQLVPVGVGGELCVGGPGVTRGYLNQPEQTAERFPRSSLLRFFASQLLRFSLYRTGDLGRWLPDGNIEFLGRIDQQVKIRGFRIELGEIENQLLKHENINEVVILLRERTTGSTIEQLSENKYICAYFVSRDVLTTKDLRTYLSQLLPGYMIPAYFVQLERIPLTSHGKIDRKALPDPAESIDTGVEYIAPGTDTQEKLAAIWQETLGIEKIGTHDNFFDLGGDSILVNRTIARIRGDLKSGVSLRAFFEHPTIAALSRIIDSGKTEKELPPIERVPRDGHIPLSFSQERLWFLQQLDGESVSYHVPRRIRIRGQLDVRMFERTYSEIIRRHEILRTEFPAVDGRPVQRVLEPFQLKIPVFDLSSYKGEELERRVSEFVTQEGRRGFDFEREPLIRITLLKLSADEHVLISAEHHLVHDGWTQGVILKEFIAIYTAFSEGKPSPLPELPVQYADYAVWQRRYMRGERLNGHLGYWKRKLAGLSPILELPGDRPRPPVISGRGAIIRYMLPEDFSTRLRTLSKANDVTVFMTMLAVFNVFLYRYVNTEIGDICVGTGIANRRLKEIEGMLGMVINTLPLRTGISGNLSFLEFLQRVKTTCIEAYEHEDTPFEKIVEHLQPERSLSYTPLFQVLFSFMDTPSQLLRLPGLELRPEDAHNRSSKFDLNIVVIVPPEEEGKELHIEWEYNTDIFEPGTAKRMLSHYKRLLEGILKHAAEPIAALPMLEESEIRQLLVEWNDISVGYPEDKTIHRLFEDQVDKRPDHIAEIGFVGTRFIASEIITISYKELNKESNRLAQLLMEKGIQPDSIVGIMVERSIEMIFGILGILKAGGAYLPIDPDYPEERIDFMLKDSGARILLTDTSSEGHHFNCQLSIVNCQLLMSNPVTRNPQSETSSSNLAYIIYTSGTTGRPKGVMVEHGNVVSLFFNEEFPFDFDSRDVWTMFHSHCFDFSVWEIFGALLFGSKVVVIPKMVARDTQQYMSMVKNHCVTVLNQTPSAFYRFIDVESNREERDSHLRYVIFGGEALSPGKLKKWRERYPRTRLINMFGITETTVHVTYKEITNHEIDNNIGNIGKPIPTLTGYIMDESQRLLPVGVDGEFYIGGAGVSRGYLNRPQLTAEKFTKNPYKIGEILYRSGDRVRVLENGEMIYAGRIDQQVQLRGFRVELGEIENQLLKYDKGKIKEAVVVDREDLSGDTYLCAYIVPGAAGVFEKASDTTDLRQFLSRSLPDYMIPSHVVKLDRIPLTANGKVDRKALPEPETAVAEEYIAPRDAVEKELVETWSDVLAVPAEGIGIDANFFEMGGHSLKATLLISKLHKAFHAKIPLAELFRTPTIRELAEYIGKQKRDTFVPIPAAENREYYELSPAQRRLYILYQMEPGSTGYNIPYMVRLEGRLDREKLDITFRKLINRHESLRTSFQVVNQQPVQKIHEHIQFGIESYPLSLISQFIRPFDLSEAPLLRVGLAKSKEQEYILMLDMHHIITDGNSQVLLVKEFISLYAGEVLEPLRTQYSDYVLWLKSEAEIERVKKQETFWLKEFQGDIPVLNLPTDFPRPAVQCFEGNRITFSICQKETMGVKTLASTRNVTLYMVLLAIFNVVLSKLSGQEDIVVGTPAAGRRHTELDHIIGMFVNTLCLRNAPSGEKVFKDFLEEVRERTLEAFEHQEYPFEDLVERLSITRDAGRNPLFDVMFALQNMENPNMEIPGLKVKSFEYEIKISKFDMTWMGAETEGQLLFTCEYSTKLFKKMTIERFAGYFKNAVSFLWENPEVTLAEVEVLSKDEKKQILFDFNRIAAAYPKNKTIQELFETQVEQTPDNIALIGSSIAMTYKELNKKSNQLAGILHEKGVSSDGIIGIMVKRSIEMLIGILGILKAGGAYLPIELGYPEERVSYMLADSCCQMVLTQKEYIKKIEDVFAGEVVDIQISESYKEDGSSWEKISKSSHLAYVIYTSGTTGRPKGTLTCHFNAVRVVRDTNYIDITNRDRVLQLSNYAFDGSVFDIYGALLNGAALVIVSAEDALSTHRLAELIKKEAVTLFFVTTALFNVLVDINIDCFEGVRKVLFGGERISVEHSRKALAYMGPRRIIHVYGPTETTVYATYYDIDTIGEDALNIPIGRPIANTSVYILDNYLNPVPLMVCGELNIGGDGVARGYLNRPELTAERFIGFNRSYRSYTSYRTGDLVRWLTDGNIEFLGRIDQQVKIRGFRIELGEIESELLKHDLITEAVVINRYNERGENYLCAYIVSKADVEVSELRQYLSKNLPDYMIPAYFMRLDFIPLNPNGKVDRGALPRPEVQTDETYSAPSSQIEKELAAIWADVLSIKKDKISVDADFFELGGHSLKATVLISEIHKKLNAAMPLAEVFRASTIRKMAAAVSQSEKQDSGDLEKIEEKEFYQLSFNQQRLLIINQLDPRSPAFHIPGTIILKHPVEKQVVQKTLRKLTERHESLRTAFKTVNDQPVQFIVKEADIPLRFIDISSLDERKQLERKEQIYVEEAGTPFDLNRVPLFRVLLLKLADHHYELFFNVHHIISDGWSLEVLRKEFSFCYEGYRAGKEVELEPLLFQYKDFARWQNQQLEDKELRKKSHGFWKKRLETGVPVQQLPADFSGENSMKGAGYRCMIHQDLKDRLKQVAKQNNTTLFMVTFSLFLLLLYRFSNQEQIVCSIIDSGREHASLHRMMGFFVNSVLFKTSVDAEEPFADFLQRTNRERLEIFKHKSYPLEPVCDDLNMRYPEVSVSFNMLNILETAAESELTPFEPYHLPRVQDVKFEIEPYITEYKNGINIYWAYKKNRFFPETIGFMAAEYIKLMEYFGTNTTATMKDYRFSGKKRRFKKSKS